ncbi:MAG TPA: tRNA (guanosine(37)-N1)-methyltransferase TrmD [Candidatus Acidoferrum sp.]|nr:tRNA (guanosine(37)-N1)-methyltransferase TrmD [Candidatus Acidoferrum sp.]
MRITIVTLFPELFESPLAASLLGKARAAGLVEIDFVNPRDFTGDRHRTVDDAPYGGGPGMVMKPDPLVAAIESAALSGSGSESGSDSGTGSDSESASAARAHRVLLTPAGVPLGQGKVRELARLPRLVLVCGRYEGIDERVSRLVIDEELSLGDFVLSGGEIAALAVVDAIARLVPGVIGDAASADEESFSDGLTLEYPHYTRPPEYRGLAVPDVLLAGHHERVRAWRRLEALRRTALRRPDLLRRRPLADADLALVAGDPQVLPAARTSLLLAHYPVYDRTGAEVTSSVTNLDIHDIARSAATYGLAATIPITPIALQREKIAHIVEVWREEAAALAAETASGHRSRALAAVEVAASIEEALALVADRHGGDRPLVVATSARFHEGASAPPTISYPELRRLLPAASARRPVALLFGTGHGLAERAISVADYLLAPIAGQPAFNHLSVRSAAAVVLDRLFGTGA